MSAVKFAYQPYKLFEVSQRHPECVAQHNAPCREQAVPLGKQQEI